MRAVLVVSALLLLAAGCDTWTHFRGGPTLAGVGSESTIGLANVATLTEQWRGSLTDPSMSDSPVVSAGRLYTAAGVFDVGGGAACSGAPKVCQPLWTLAGSASVDGPTTVSGGLQVRLPRSSLSGAETLAAFDAAGSTGCDGSPKVCQPVRRWRLPAAVSSLNDAIDGISPPTIVGSTILAGDLGEYLAASTLTGDASCAGTPVVCRPVWFGRDVVPVTPMGPPAVVGGRVYVQAVITGPGSGSYPPAPRGDVVVYDQAGVSSCSGSPVMCDPLWRYDLGVRDWQKQQVGPWTTPVVDGVLYAARRDVVGNGRIGDSIHPTTGTLMAFDANGVQGCTGTPATCQPLWSAPLPGDGQHLGLVGIAVSGGRVYVPTESGVSVFDAKGGSGCSGTPKVCSPLATLSFGSSPGTRGGVTIANGVAYVGSMDGLFAFDANLSQGCSGTPLVCQPVVHALVGTSVTTPAVVDGRVHVLSNGQVVTLGLP